MMYLFYIFYICIIHGKRQIINRLCLYTLHIKHNFFYAKDFFLVKSWKQWNRLVSEGKTHPCVNAHVRDSNEQGERKGKCDTHDCIERCFYAILVHNTWKSCYMLEKEEQTLFLKKLFNQSQ